MCFDTNTCSWKPRRPDPISAPFFSKLLRHEPRFFTDRVTSGMSVTFIVWTLLSNSDDMLWMADKEDTYGVGTEAVREWLLSCAIRSEATFLCWQLLSLIKKYYCIPRKSRNHVHYCVLLVDFVFALTCLHFLYKLSFLAPTVMNGKIHLGDPLSFNLHKDYNRLWEQDLLMTLNLSKAVVSLLMHRRA